MTHCAPPDQGVTTPPAFDLQHYLETVADYYHPGRPGYFHPRDHERGGIMPLWKFDDDRLERILNLATGRRQPPRWIQYVGCQMESRAWHEWHWTRGRKLQREEGYEPRARRHIPDALRFAVYERDGWACLHCGATENLSLDHIYPYSLGGPDTLDNLQTLCRPCNSRKGARI